MTGRYGKLREQDIGYRRWGSRNWEEGGKFDEGVSDICASRAINQLHMVWKGLLFYRTYGMAVCLFSQFDSAFQGCFCFLVVRTSGIY
jgi:hypothetical protein